MLNTEEHFIPFSVRIGKKGCGKIEVQSACCESSLHNEASRAIVDRVFFVFLFFVMFLVLSFLASTVMRMFGGITIGNSRLAK
jgi:hypothetical protein